MLERLCKSRLYSRDADVFRDHGGYDPVLVTKLVKNYRSHQSIIEIPSRLFYHGDLQVCAP
jgi:putative helicase MOV10L1